MKSKYSVQNITTIVFVLFVAYIYCIYFAPYIERNYTDSFIDKIHKLCLYKCATDKCIKYMIRTRGENYFISTPHYKQKEIKKCILTFWGVTHFVLYFILSFLFPAFYIDFFLLGIIFEIYEYYKFTCHDYNDLFLNTLGIVLGKILSPY